MRTVVVTGGASGIGLAVVRRFAAAGDRVVILDRDADAAQQAARSLGSDIHAAVCDIADEHAVIAAIAQVLAWFGSIDVLINNAGIVDPAGSDSLAIPAEIYASVFAVNLEGTFVAAREAGRAMLAQGHGVIVNVASLAGIVALPGRMAYAASKAAVLGLTAKLAREWGPGGVRVNAVLPGYVATEIVQSLVRSGKVDVSQVARRIPLGRLAQPDEIAAVIEHLASDAGSYAMGSLVEVDGGYHAFGGSGPASSGESLPTQPRVGSRHVLVTGGASGSGAATVRHFVRAGDRVTILDNNRAAALILADEMSGSTCAVIADVRDEVAICAAVDRASAAFGPVDVLVNAAGTAGSVGPVIAHSLAGLRQSVAVGLTGALLVARAVAPMMIARRHGAIVNLASGAGLAGVGGDCAAHAGVVMLTRSLACEWARHGIRVNAIAHGDGPAPCDPAKIATAVAFLASPAASYMTGAVHAVAHG